MLRNNNKRFIRTLTGNCLKANKSRNIMAVLAIILTAMLFTSVATVIEGTSHTVKEQQLRISGTRFMTSIKYMTEEVSDKIMKDPAFSKIGKSQFLGPVKNEELKKIYVNATLADKAYVEDCYMTPAKGALPEKENEVALSTTVLDLLKLPHEIGGKFTMKYQINDETRDAEMTISGIFTGRKGETASDILVSQAFFDQEMKNVSLPRDGEAGSGSIVLRGSFASEKDIDNQLAEVVRRAGFNPEAEVGDKDFLRANINPAYEASVDTDPIVYLMGGACILIILIAGYLIIYNIFQISVIKDIRLYGQLKTIGTSPKQLRYIVRNQGLLLSLIGIPFGLFLGYFLGNLLLRLVMASTAYADVSFVPPNVLVLVASAAFAFLTVWISCKKPGKTASKISPVEALRYSGQKESKRKNRKGGESHMRIVRMAMANMSDSKGKTALIVISIALSIILVNSVINWTSCFDKETYVYGRVAADFNVTGIDFGRSEASDQDVQRTVPKEFFQAVSQVDGIKDPGKIYYYHPKGSQEADLLDEVAVIKQLNGKAYPHKEEGGKQLYGFDQNAVKRCKVVSGSFDAKKFASGKYILELGYLDDRGKNAREDGFNLKPGDKISGVCDGKKIEYEVMAQVACLSELMADGSIGEYGTLVLPESEFTRLYKGAEPLHYIFDAQKGSFGQLDDFLSQYQDRGDSGIKYTSRASAEEDFNQVQETYRMAGLILAGIFGIIGLLNLLNVIITGAVARQREFAVMQSVGMTRKQLRTLFILEGVFYAALAVIAGLVISAVLSLTIVKGLTSLFWFSIYHFTLVPALCVAPAFIVLAAVLAYVIDRVWNKGSVVEKLRRTK